MAIFFHEENIKPLKLKKRNLKTWIKNCVLHYDKKVGDINYIFCNDDYLKDINVQYLNHDYFTDVITFDNSVDSVLHGDIFISVDRVGENAKLYNVDFLTELSRVMIHGVLHLAGYKDVSDLEKSEMRKQEDFCLSKLEKE